MTGRGINAHVASRLDIDKVVACGCEWVRLDFDWRTIESKKGTFKWSPYDTMLDYAKSKGLKTYVTLAYVPTWLNADKRVCPDIFNWTFFVTKVAQRYCNDVDVFSLWNEPNLNAFFLGSKEDYIKNVLEPGYNAIKSIDGNSQVAAGDLATVSGSDWYDWFRLLKRNSHLFDCFSWHVYQDSAKDVIKRYESGKFPPIGWIVSKWRPFSWQIDEIRDMGKRIFLTETGIKAKTSSEKELDSQLNFVKDLNSIVEKTKSEAVFIYDLLDHAQFKDKWGIFDDDGKPKKSAQWLMNNISVEETEEFVQA